MEWDFQSTFENNRTKISEPTTPTNEHSPSIAETITLQHTAPCKIKKKRSRTGSLTVHHSDPRERSVTTNGFYRDATIPVTTNGAIRKIPIAGGSWDDNSLGHGSVVARMRRERNRAVYRTQSNTVNSMCNPIDTHANVTSTLNLINTTALAPWVDERYRDTEPWLKFPWERNVVSQQYHHSASARRSAGSTQNMPTSSNHSSQTWDTLSTPDVHCYTRHGLKAHHRHSYSSGNAHNTSHLHSSTTSGCASIASSDLDSADFMFFNINDDPAYYDGDSMFSESMGMMEDANSFSTNILSLLEEGSISCRTPFPASDWPDSISELDFDCNEGMPEDVANCDALSDIGPSCSTPPHRRRMAKNSNMMPNLPCEQQFCDLPDPLQIAADVPQPTPDESDELELIGEPVNVDIFLNHNADQENTPSLCEVVTPTTETNVNNDDLSIVTKESELPWFTMSKEKRIEYIESLSKRIAETLNIEEQLAVIRMIDPEKTSNVGLPYKIPVYDMDVNKLQKVLGYLENKQKQSLDGSNESTTATCKNNTDKTCDLPMERCNITIDESYHSVKIAVENSNNIVGSKKSLRQKSDNVKKKIYNSYGLEMVLRERPVSRHDGSTCEANEPSHKDTCTDPKCSGCSTNLRRSNSDGNLPKSTMSEAQKEHRRRQRQARRWAKYLKQRQRKENRQLLKEHKSGLFMKEQRVKLETEGNEEDDTDIEV